MLKPRFSLRTLFAATAAVGALLATAAVENKIATAAIALAAATMLPPALLTTAIRSRGCLRLFCLGALIPAGLMFGFVAWQAGRRMNNVSFGLPLAEGPYFREFCDWFCLDVRYVVFGFGLASLVAGLTAVATNWLLPEVREEKTANDQTE